MAPQNRALGCTAVGSDLLLWVHSQGGQYSGFHSREEFLARFFAGLLGCQGSRFQMLQFGYCRIRENPIPATKKAYGQRRNQVYITFFNIFECFVRKNLRAKTTTPDVIRRFSSPSRIKLSGIVSDVDEKMGEVDFKSNSFHAILTLRISYLSSRA